MERYFFNLSDGKREEDDVGVMLPGRQAACAAAITFAGELLKDSPELLSNHQDLNVEIANEQGETLFTVSINTDCTFDPTSNEAALVTEDAVS